MVKINPRVDIAFKKIFGVEENKDLLVSLINAIVSPADQVKEVTLLNPYNSQNFPNDKLSILDIKATGENGQRFNIEIQITDTGDYDKRALYYWAKLYSEQLQLGSSYGSLEKAIGIHILNFHSIPETAAYHNVFHITEKEKGFSHFQDLELHTIELKKFSGDPKEDLNGLLAKVRNSLDMWSAFLTRHDLLNKEALPRKLDDPALKKALDVLEVMNFKGEEQQAYDDHVKWLLTQASALKKREAEGREEGRAEGRAEGKIEGEAIGLQKGLQKGREEGREESALAIAKNMLARNMDVDSIALLSGISLEKIKKLMKEFEPELS
jgi:predicted transposase/invertase (TIGR01784 family)